MSETAETLAALDVDTIAARLSGTPEGRAAFIAQAARAGVAEAQLLYGQLLLDGNGVAADPVAALGWFGKAATGGNLMALNMVGRCHDLGWGTPPDKARAAECYLAAAGRGLDWAMYNYATLLALGDGVAEDRAGALAWLRRAAALGNAKAINFVGSFHEDGWATPVDMAAARRCYAEAAEGGDFRGRFNHARMLIVAGDMVRASTWIGRLPENATPAFLAKVRDWLARHPNPAVGALATALIPGDGGTAVATPAG